MLSNKEMVGNSLDQLCSVAEDRMRPNKLAASLLVGAIAIFAPAQIGLTSAKDNLDQASVQIVHMKVHVTGEDRLPIEGAKIEYLQPYREVKTDAHGEAEFYDSAPYVVIGLAGYRSVRLRVASADDVHAVLRKLPNNGVFHTCTAAEMTGRAPGWNGLFQVPKSLVKSAATEQTDVDYVARTGSVRETDAHLHFRQGRGPMWAGLGPSDEQVEQSTEYQEAAYQLGNLPILDAQGTMPNGQCWRTLGTSSESIYYADVNCAELKPLDELFDRICVIPDASKHLPF